MVQFFNFTHTLNTAKFTSFLQSEILSIFIPTIAHAQSPVLLPSWAMDRKIVFFTWDDSSIKEHIILILSLSWLVS